MGNLSKYEEFLERKQRQYKGALSGNEFDARDLDLRFVSAFNDGTRIKVMDLDGTVHFGHVGVTSGWRPAFLLMHNSRCIGSSLILGPSYKIVAVKRGRQYVECAA